MLGSDNDDHIARSPRKLDRKTFLVLFRLTTTQPWLEARQTELSGLLDICQSTDEQLLVCDLLFRFAYISQERAKLAFRDMAARISTSWSCFPQTTTVVAINKTDYADSSQMLLWYLKPALAEFGGWETNNFVSTMTAAVDKCCDGGSLILIDEFVGTGKTMAKAVSWIKRHLVEQCKQVTIYVCVLAAMEASKAIVEEEGVVFYSNFWLSRGISDHFSDTELADATAQMTRLEKELAAKDGSKLLAKYSFGWQRSESLYYFENGDVPNNVFPIFWWPRLLKHNKQYSPMFKRI